MFFYLCFPLILFVLKNSKVSAIKIIIMALAFYFFSLMMLINLMTSDFNQGYQTFSFDLIYYFPLSHLSSFLLGVAGGYLYVKKQNHFNQSGPLSYVLILAGFSLNYFVLQNTALLHDISGVGFK